MGACFCHMDPGSDYIVAKGRAFMCGGSSEEIIDDGMEGTKQIHHLIHIDFVCRPSPPSTPNAYIHTHTPRDFCIYIQSIPGMKLENRTYLWYTRTSMLLIFIRGPGTYNMCIKDNSIIIMDRRWPAHETACYKSHYHFFL